MMRMHPTALVMAALLAGCELAKVPVTVENTSSGVTIHCESLGEYPSDIGAIELRDAATQEVVWSVRPVGQLFQLHSVISWRAQTPRSFPCPGVRSTLSSQRMVHSFLTVVGATS